MNPEYPNSTFLLLTRPGPIIFPGNLISTILKLSLPVNMLVELITFSVTLTAGLYGFSCLSLLLVSAKTLAQPSLAEEFSYPTGTLPTGAVNNLFGGRQQS